MEWAGGDHTGWNMLGLRAYGTDLPFNRATDTCLPFRPIRLVFLVKAVK